MENKHDDALPAESSAESAEAERLAAGVRVAEKRYRRALAAGSEGGDAKPTPEALAELEQLSAAQGRADAACKLRDAGNAALWAAREVQSPHGMVTWASIRRCLRAGWIAKRLTDRLDARATPDAWWWAYNNAELARDVVRDWISVERLLRVMRAPDLYKHCPVAWVKLARNPPAGTAGLIRELKAWVRPPQRYCPEGP